MTLSSQTELALVDEDRKIGDRERLAGRAVREDRVGIDEFRRAELAHAEALGERDLVVFDDRDRHAGHADVLAQRFDALLEVGGRCGEGVE